MDIARQLIEQRADLMENTSVGLSCRKCGSRNSAVIDSRARSRTKSRTYFDYIRRRRKCLECSHRITTYETSEKPSKYSDPHFAVRKILAFVKDLLETIE